MKSGSTGTLSCTGQLGQEAIPVMLHALYVRVFGPVRHPGTPGTARVSVAAHP